MAETLYDLLRQAAERAPDHPAISFQGREVTYGQMLEDSDRTASLLAEQGAAPGRRVAFCFRKSPEALIALFAIIRTGAAYVPLDPAWPAERQQTVCQEAGIELWVGNVQPGFPGLRHTVLATPESGFPPRGLPRAAAERGEPERGVANILYTSGSTGRPKGIEITTLSLLHFSQWAVDYFEIGPADRVANHAPYNFDLSTLDIFAAVRAGATMCPVPEEVKVLPYQMARFIAQQRITIWYSVPFALIAMLPKLGAHDLSRLRHVIFAGEVMPKPALQELARALPHARFTNLYGPTETNVCTFHGVIPEDLASEESVPIGRAISDTRLWLVDEHGESVPEGTAGELLVAGPTLTTGYFGDAELTARRLVPAPDGDGLAYRTGDLVVPRPDGVLLFRGRIDRMIKCRGYRIEPGEVEAVLGQHPRVREAAVLLAVRPDGDRLEACLACDPAEQPSETELAEWCQRSLPAYMVPDSWRFFPALPRTDRDKIDLQRLAASSGKR
jgi:amino acid adenylation domain-containing protein